jgi:hypothetical protein
MLEKAFSTDNLRQGIVYGVYGPGESGKTSAIFAVADHWGMELVVAEPQGKEGLLDADAKRIILVDPADAFTLEDVETITGTYRGTSSVILVGRNQADLEKFKPKIFVAMVYPNLVGITQYLEKMLSRYKHSLSPEDFTAIAEALLGLSYPQINSITVDAALAGLVQNRSVEQSAFVEAIETFKVIKQRYS